MARRKVGKNAACPCGSGKRYKSCCLKTERTQTSRRRAAVALRQRETQLNAEVCDKILYLLDETLGRDPFQNAPLDIRDPSMHDMLAPWAAYQPATLDILGSLLGADMNDEQRAWFEAQRHAQLGLWEVTNIDERLGLQLCDRLTGVTRTVLEPAHAAEAEVGDHFVARVVPVDDRARWVGRYPVALVKEVADHFLPMFLQGIRSTCDLGDAPLTPAVMAQHRASFSVLVLTQAIADQMREERLPPSALP